MKGVKIILWILGIGFLTPVILMVLPWHIIENIIVLFGEEPIPKMPVVVYLFRVSCVCVGLIGIYFIILARNPSNYRTLIFYSASGLIACGILCFIIGLVAGISPVFPIGDGLFGVVSGSVLALLTSKAFKTSG